MIITPSDYPTGTGGLKFRKAAVECLQKNFLRESRFGATRNVNGFPHVVGDIVGPNGWDDTLCCI